MSSFLNGLSDVGLRGLGFRVKKASLEGLSFAPKPRSEIARPGLTSRSAFGHSAKKQDPDRLYPVRSPHGRGRAAPSWCYPDVGTKLV